jgi:hypothetical protein
MGLNMGEGPIAGNEPGDPVITATRDSQMQQILSDAANGPAAIAVQAMARFRSQESYQSQVVQKMRFLHNLYAPQGGDQWPSDVVKRPGKIHVTVNFCKPAVDVDSRLQSILPRLTIPTATLSPKERLRAEAAEQMYMLWLEMSGWETWMNVLCQTKSLYGKGILKPYWNKKLGQVDVSVVENPAMLRLGWSNSEYSSIDWSIYEFGLSPMEVKARWPNVTVQSGMNPQDPPQVIIGGGNHADPLMQRINDYWVPRWRQLSDYERAQIKVWDYWYVDDDQVVCNAMLVNGQVVDGPHKHKYLPDIPYIVIENDHEPSSPEGISTIEPIVDLQEEFNRLMSHGLQHIADDVDPAWYMRGPSADAVQPGIIPTAGKVIGVGENDINLIPKGVNNFPIQEMIGEMWNEFHRLTGLPEILFGQTPGADTSGRAVAIQVEAASNRLDPRRRRLYQGLKELLIFWGIMIDRKNPTIEVPDPNTGEMAKAQVKDLVGNFKQWKIIPPEITPRDNAEITQNEINKVNAKLSSLRTSMDAIGIEAPEAELSTIEQEMTNINLNPGQVQAKVSIYPILQQIQQTQAQLSQMLEAQGSQPGQSVLAQAQGAANGALNEQQAGAPTAFEDQNQPPTGQGSAPPAGAGAQAGPATTTLIRGGQALNQIAINDNPLQRFGQRGDASQTFAFLVQQNDVNLRASAQRVDSAREAELAAMDAATFTKYQEGKISGGAILHYIRTRIAQTSYDKAQQIKWKSALVQYTNAVADQRAEAAYAKTGNTAAYISHWRKRLAGTKRGTPERTEIQQRLRSLREERDGKNIIRGALKIQNDIALGNATTKDLIDYYKEARRGLPQNSPLHEQILSTLASLREKQRNDRFEAEWEAVDTELAQGQGMTPQDAATQKSAILEKYGIQESRPADFQNFLQEVNMLRATPDPVMVAQAEVDLIAGNITPEEYGLMMQDWARAIAPYDQQAAWELTGQGTKIINDYRESIALPNGGLIGNAERQSTPQAIIQNHLGRRLTHKTQLDGSRWSLQNCTMAAAAMLAHTMGVKGLTGADLRYDSRDRSGGTNLVQAQAALQLNGVENTRARFSDRIEFNGFKNNIKNGAPAVLSGWLGALATRKRGSWSSTPPSTAPATKASGSARTSSGPSDGPVAPV